MNKIKYFFYEDTENNLAKIYLTYMIEPPTKLKNEKNYFATDIAIPEPKAGYGIETYFNKELERIEFKEVKLPPSPEELAEKEKAEMQRRISDLELIFADIIGGEI